MAEAVKTIQLSLYTPRAAPMTSKAKEIQLPGQEGVLTVYPEHTPLLTALQPGVMIVWDMQGGETHYAIHGGFAEVSRDYVLVLTDSIEAGDDIDAGRAEAARQRAEERLQASRADLDLARAEAALLRADARLSAHARDSA